MEFDPMSTLALNAGSVAAYEHLSPLDQALVSFLLRYPNPNTHREYKRDLKQYLAWCSDLGITPLTASEFHVEGYLRSLEGRGLAEATVSRRFGTVRVFYQFLARRRFIERDPSLDIDRPDIDREKQKRTVLNAVQWAQLLTAARQHSPTAHALVALLGMRGLRIHEACLLDIETHLSNEDGYDVLRFVGKGSKAAMIVLPPPVSRALKECIAERTSGPLLLNSRGRRMDRASANRLLHRCAVEGALTADFSPHSLRRTMITLGLASGQSLYEMQLIARHQDPKTTMIYDCKRRQIDRNSGAAVASFMSAIAG